MQFLKSRSTEALNWGLAALAVLAIGFGTATAAISVAPGNAINPAMQPLSSGPSIQIQAGAYGEDDEDCFWAVRKVVQADGRVVQVRKLECAQ